MYVKSTKTFGKIPKSVLGLMGLSLTSLIVAINAQKEQIRIVPLDISITAITEMSNANNSTATPQLTPQDNTASEAVDIPDYKYIIRDGDNLTNIFNRLDISTLDLQKINQEDFNYLRIDTLKAGNKLSIWIDKQNNRLLKLELEFNIASKVQYIRQPDGSFKIHEISIPGEWVQTIFKGKISGSFSQSARNVGLSYNEISFITNLLKDKINFSRDLKAGDQFSIVSNDEYINNEPTGNREILAIQIRKKNRAVTAYRHNDGAYYDATGKSLQRAFQRSPTVNTQQISSHFNPKRKHPVTGQLAPHNGTDFGVKTGTHVVSTGDGVVVMVRNHPYAGNYVVIDHGNQVRTRYLHNSKVVVRKGQQVHRGQLIALSGKTGRVTGPHIHYEMLIRGKAVDPMKAYASLTKSVPEDEIKQFTQNVKMLSRAMGS